MRSTPGERADAFGARPGRLTALLCGPVLVTALTAGCGADGRTARAAPVTPGADREAAQALPAPGEPARKPNVVFILTDDQRWDTLWAMPAVQRELVQRGVTFTNAFASNPLCCPSRATILTGDYAHTTRVYHNVGRLGGFRAFRDSSTVATWLHAAGYRTGLFGKYLNGYRLPEYVPPGWERWVAFAGANGAYFDFDLAVDGEEWVYREEDRQYSTELLGDMAAAFVREAEAPFFLYFAPFAPHQPAQPPTVYEDGFSDLEPWRPPSFDEADVSDKPAHVSRRPRLTAKQRDYVEEFRADQYRSLLSVDDAVAEILDAVADTGRMRDTLVVFASDNGVMWGEHRHLGASKVAPYEESIRIPLVVRYDRVIARPRRDGHLVVNTDFAPTFADVADARHPRVEGRTLLPLLSSPDARWRRDFLVESARGRPQLGVPTYCGVRSRGYLYVGYQTGEEELYDLRRDPHELENVARRAGSARVLARLRARTRKLCSPPPPGLRPPSRTRPPSAAPTPPPEARPSGARPPSRAPHSRRERSRAAAR